MALEIGLNHPCPRYETLAGGPSDPFSKISGPGSCEGGEPPVLQF